jgi:hypothetical protein
VCPFRNNISHVAGYIRMDPSRTASSLCVLFDHISDASADFRTEKSAVFAIPSTIVVIVAYIFPFHRIVPLDYRSVLDIQNCTDTDLLCEY